jgi:hypothetical protein
MRFTALFYLCFVLCFSHVAKTHADSNHPSAPPQAGQTWVGATIDLTTQSGVELVKGAWRYSDVQLVPTKHRAPDANGQPTGAPVDTWDYQPHAGSRDFDDSSWSTLDPATLSARRGPGRITFNWYRIAITVPRAVDGVDVSGANL